MNLDLDLYRTDVVVAESPRRVRLSVIDLALKQPPARTLLFIHGFGGFARQWKNQLNYFADDSRVVAPDLRGHGLSDKPDSLYSMEEMVEDVHKVVQALNLPDKFILLAHSFGGALAAAYAVKYPESVEKMITIATPATYAINPAVRVALRSPRLVAGIIYRLFPVAVGAPAFVLQLLYRNNMRVWNPDAVFPKVQAPTLVIQGHRDFVFAQSAYERVAELIPNAQRMTVPVSAHMVMLERADATNRAIERFIGAAPNSWRERASKANARLVKQHPWLKNYERDVPYEIAIPRQPLFRFLESAARQHPHRRALIFFEHALSYRELDDATNRLANALLALGVKKGDRVILVLPNSPPMVIAFYATLKIGAVVVSANPLFTEDELTQQVKDSGAETLVTLSLFQKTAQLVKARTNLRRVILTNIKEYFSPLRQGIFSLTRETREGHRLESTDDGTTYSWQDLLKRAPANSPNLNVDPNELAVIQYTGGTTDVPKGVMLSHLNLVANTLQVRHWIPDLREGAEVSLGVLPFSHSYGMTAVLNLSISIAATIVLLPSFQTREVLEAAQKYRPTLFPGVPTMYVAINNYPNVRQYGLRSIRACVSGAAPLPLEVQEAFEKLTKGKLVEGYGLTEASPVTHANPIYGARRAGAMGVPLPNTDAKIVDLKTGADVPPGDIGELAVRGPQVMLGYWKRADETARALREGWLFTGDVARMDEDGYFQIIDRKKDMILAGHFNVYPRDVEEVLYENPKVFEATVVGVPADHPETVKAYIVLKKGEVATPEEFIEYCRARLEEYAVPRLVEFRDSLPKTFVGKVLRRKLMEEGDNENKE